MVRNIYHGIYREIREYDRLTAEIAAIACAIANMHQRGALDNEWLGIAIKEIRETEQRRALVFKKSAA